ncbi:MAG: hypothetical protein O7D30_10075, partial [Rickettsia endosymbiont of Ixodes persulcatus]|nr:hypothetical protein [Rickettsia endosymbiont of Ixodes persulcatus]
SPLITELSLPSPFLLSPLSSLVAILSNPVSPKIDKNTFFPSEATVNVFHIIETITAKYCISCNIGICEEGRRQFLFIHTTGRQGAAKEEKTQL